MAVFTGAERDYLRCLFGSSKLFVSSNSQFERVLDAIDGLVNDPVDLGATQVAIRVTLAKLRAVETQLDNLTNLMLGTEVIDRVKVNAIRNDFYLRTYVGPALITQIANRLSFNPLIKYFSPASTQDGGNALIHRPTS